MTDHFPHTPILSKQPARRPIAIKIALLLPLTLLYLIGSPPSSLAAIISPIQFEWNYDTTLPGLMGYTIYQDNQPIANIPDPYSLSTELNVFLEVGAQNTFTITAYDNLGNVSNPSLPYLIAVPPEDDSGNIPPVASLDISSVSGPAPLTVDVSASRSIDYDGMIIAYAWDLGDGGFSNYEKDFYTFDAPGMYTVILDVTDDSGSLSTAETTVTVTDPQATTNEPPTALLYTTTNSGPAPLDVLFDGTDSTDSDGIINDYLWDFGDGNSASGSFVNYTYTAIGIFTGQLSVTDDGGASATDQTEITVTASDTLNNPPSAVINADPLTGAAPLTTTFSGSNSTDPDGVIISYNWDFGDGSIASSADATHRYITSGTYTATLTVTDEFGDTGLSRVIISVTDPVLPTTQEVVDDFNVDTTPDYTSITGALSVSNGVAHGQVWRTTLAYHNTPLGSSDHWVQAEVAYNGGSESGGVTGRVNEINKTGYYTRFESERIALYRFSETTRSWLSMHAGQYQSGTYSVRMQISGSTIRVFVDGVLVIEQSDTTYPTGNHAGLSIYRGITDITADNFKAGTEAPPPLTQQNNAPVAQSTSITTTEDSPISGTFIVSDLDGNELTAEIVSNGTLGTAVITNPLTGAYTYTPNNNISGIDTFTFKVNDGTEDSNKATVTVTITEVNDPPTAQADTAVCSENASVIIDALANDSDIEGDLLIISGVGQPAHGTAVISNNQILYTPAANYNGTDSFSYQITDNRGGTATGVIEVSVTEVNFPPLTVDSSLITQENNAATGILTASDEDGDNLIFSIVKNGILGTAVVTDKATGAYTYTPNLNISGVDTFTFKTNDGSADSNIATITVTIEKTPVGGEILDDFNVDTTPDYTSITGDLSVSNGVAHGQMWRTTLAYHNTPLGSSDHWVQAEVAYNGGSESGGVTGRVDETNKTGYYTRFESERIALYRFSETTRSWLSMHAGQYQSGTYSVRMQISGSTIRVFVDGVLVIEQSDTTYPTGNHAGLSISRGSTDITADNFKAGTETPPPLPQQNNAPVASDFSITTPENNAATGILTASDEDGDNLTFSIVKNGSLGTAVVTDKATGAYTYTPNLNISGVDTFTFKANDGSADSNIATITVTIEKTTVDGEILDDFNVDTTPDYTSTTGALSVSNGVAHGQVWRTTLAYHNTPLGSSDHWVQAEVAYNGGSESGGVTGRVDETNKTGYYTRFESERIALYRFSETTRTWLSMYAGQYQSGTYSVRMQISGSTIRVFVDGVLVIEQSDTTYPTGNHAGLSISRGSTDITADNFKAGTETPPPLPQQNNAPVASDSSITTPENNAATGILTASDEDGDNLTFSIVKNGSLGTAVVTDKATGAYTYTPNLNISGVDTFTFKANDGSADSNIATITVTIEKTTVDGEILDDFNVDTTPDYTSITGALSVSNGVAHGQVWRTTLAYHNTPLGSADHWVQAEVAYNGGSESGGVTGRVDETNKTGYYTRFESERIALYRFSETTRTWLSMYAGQYQSGTYSVRMQISGSTIRVFVDGVLVIEQSDTTYPTGNHAGLSISRGSTDITADNFKAGTGTLPPLP